MNDLKPLTQRELLQVARGKTPHHRSKAPKENSKRVEATLHIAFTGDELDGRRMILAFQSALLDRGLDVYMTGPEVAK